MPELEPTDLPLHELRRDDVDLEGRLLADLLVEVRIGLHLLGEDLDGLGHREVVEALPIGLPLRTGLPAGVGDFLLFGFLRLRCRDFPEGKQPLVGVDPLPLSPAEELTLEPLDLLLEQLDFLLLKQNRFGELFVGRFQ